MKSIKIYLLYIVTQLVAIPLLGQQNILPTSGFEGNVQLGDYPRFDDNIAVRGPAYWTQFHNETDVRWFIDSVWAPTNQNQQDPNFQTGHYNMAYFNAAYPWHEGSTWPDSMIALKAHGGNFYVGFDAKTDGFNRQGVQAFTSSCGLNTGIYAIDLFWSRVYGNPEPSKIFLSLSDQQNTRRYIFDDFVVGPTSFVPGQWYPYSSSFEIHPNNADELGNDWFSITGQAGGNSNPDQYMYFDDIRLYRPCDETLECSPTHGQICPTVATMAPPGDIFRISNISNAKDLRLKIYMNNGAIIKDTTWHNANGMPDFRFTRLDLPISTAAATYQYDLHITNDCGGFRKTGSVFVQDTASYNPVTLWSDPTANWTGVPIPCCLDQLFLQNTQIVGDVSYIVRDQITVLNGVSMAPNSHVTLQAGQVVELYGVDFDGTNSTLEIVEVPCPNRMACGQGCTGGSMVMDAGEFVMPLQVAADSQGTVKGNVAPTTPTEIAKPAIEAETRLWAYPNPFEKEFQIGIALPTPMACTVLVQDLQLRPIRTVMQDKELPAGSHQLNVDLGGLPAGVYLVQLQAGGRNYHQRVVKQ